jgi:thiosulfate/3-mercaptopyruvate sulfurtransferase
MHIHWTGTTGVPMPQYFLASLIGMAPGTAMFIYIGSTLRNLADALRGDLSGGEDGDSSSGTIRLIALIIGLIATVVVTVFITIKAKATLSNYVADDDEAEGAQTGFEAAQAKAEEGPAPKQLDPPAPWKVPVFCFAGWLLLLGSLFIVVFFGIIFKERVDFTPTGASDDMFITAEDLKPLADAGTATILDARGSFGDHIPGAQHAKWEDFAVGGSESTKSVLKPNAELQSLLSTRGVTASRKVVVYGDWANAWGEEGRLLWMLDYLGHPDVKVLYGGIDAWEQPAPNGKGYATSSSAARALTGTFVSPGLQEQFKATSDEIAAAVQLQLCNYVFFDTRTKAEYEGSAAMYNAARDGRIPNAIWYPWEQVFDADGGNLKDKDVIKAELEAMGVSDNSIVVSYCTGGIRSGFMYMVLRWLGYDGTGTQPLARESSQPHDTHWHACAHIICTHNMHSLRNQNGQRANETEAFR